jgi:hypothetical protein
MKGSLCDRQPQIIRPHFSTRIKAGSGLESGKEIASCTRKTAAPQNCALWAAVLFLCLFSSFKVLGQEPPQEYQIKAAFLFNFAKFVEWPPGTFPSANSPITIGVVGNNVFGHYLEDTIRGKTVQNRPFEFKELKSANDAAHCQILFVSPSLKDDLSGIIKDLHNASILTVSETDQFLKAGGMINFIIQDNKIHFEINDEAAKAAGLKISSKLLSLAARGH